MRVFLFPWLVAFLSTFSSLNSLNPCNFPRQPDPRRCMYSVKWREWWCISSDTDEPIPCPKTCATAGGNDPGRPCVFPFVYRGVQHWRCLSFEQNNSNSWRFCATTANLDKDRLWTHCHESCQHNGIMTAFAMFPVIIISVLFGVCCVLKRKVDSLRPEKSKSALKDRFVRLSVRLGLHTIHGKLAKGPRGLRRIWGSFRSLLLSCVDCERMREETNRKQSQMTYEIQLSYEEPFGISGESYNSPSSSQQHTVQLHIHQSEVPNETQSVMEVTLSQQSGEETGKPDELRSSSSEYSPHEYTPMLKSKRTQDESRVSEGSLQTSDKTSSDWTETAKESYNSSSPKESSQQHTAQLHMPPSKITNVARPSSEAAPPIQSVDEIGRTVAMPHDSLNQLPEVTCASKPSYETQRSTEPLLDDDELDTSV